MGNVIKDLAEGGAKGLFSGIGSMAKDIRTAITGIDPEKQAAIEEKLLELEASAEQAQNKINEVEAQNPSLFVSGWRPFIGWVCGSAFAYNYLLSPFLQALVNVFGNGAKIPVLDLATMMPVMFGMLGLGTMRSYEKKNNVARW